MTSPSLSADGAPLMGFHKLLLLGSGGGLFVAAYLLSLFGVAAAGNTFFGLILAWMLAPVTRSLNVQQAASLG